MSTFEKMFSVQLRNTVSLRVSTFEKMFSVLQLRNTVNLRVSAFEKDVQCPLIKKYYNYDIIKTNPKDCTHGNYIFRNFECYKNVFNATS